MINPLLNFQSALYFSRKCPLFALYFDRKMPSICPLFGCLGPLNIIGQYALVFTEINLGKNGSSLVSTGTKSLVLDIPPVQALPYTLHPAACSLHLPHVPCTYNLHLQVEEGDGLTVFLDGQYMVPPWEPLAILRWAHPAPAPAPAPALALASSGRETN